MHEQPKFDDRRDTAIVRLFLDTGMRLSEMAGLTLSDIDLDADVALVLGKGRRPRTCPFGDKTAQAIERYLRERSKHRLASSNQLWIGGRGDMTDNGIGQMLRRRAKEAGLEHLHPHMFRHTFAHRWQMSGIAFDASFGGSRDRVLPGFAGQRVVGEAGARAA